MPDRKFKIFFFVCFLILANIPSVLCIASAPIVYVSGDESGDFNCNATNADLQINEALQFVAENPDYTTVYLKGPFTYVINDTLSIGNNITLAGDSSTTIKLVNNANWSVSKPIIEEKSSGSHDITIRGFKIDGNREGNTNTNITSGKGYYDLIHLTGCQNINVCDMYLTNNHGDGLKTDYCSNIKLYDNTIYELGHDALYASYCSDAEAYNNTITCRTNSGLRLYNSNNASFHDNVITSNNAGGVGIEIQKWGTPVMDNIEVYNNTIYRTALAGIWIFGSNSYLPLSANVHIHHNRIYDTGTRSNNKVIGGILSDGFNALIENNVIDGSYGAGIVQNNVYSPGPDGSGYVVVVKNNIITNTRTSTAGGNGYGIYNLLTDTHSFVLQNNCFYNTGGDFIDVQASPSDIVADPQYADRINHDYHLKSKAGRWDGNGWVNDSIRSPCIDAGNPLSNYSNEPEPNGNRINMGQDGNTWYASKSEMDLPTPTLPTANFISNITSGYIPLSIQFIDISQNPTTWNWNFGDNTYSTQQSPIHTYSAVGNYTLMLSVSNENGTDSKSATITVSEIPVLPVANFNTNMISGYAPLSVQFTDLSQNAASWYWNFGDGAVSTELNPVHTYSSAGSYTVTQIVSNTNGTNSKYATITVLQKPILPAADFSGSVSQGYAPLSVQFTDLSQNAASWYWNFGDGAVSTEPNPVHTYSSAGSYTVTQTVSNANGTNSKSDTITVSERPVLPVANFNTNTISGYAPLSVQFTDLSQNAASWYWDFGDGAVSTQPNPVHTYSSAGSYPVTLTESNTNGTNSKYATISVLERPIIPAADFSTSVTSGYTPLSVQFTDLSQNAASRYWNFGDGDVSSEPNPVHTYSSAGSYTITQTVSNANGTNSKSDTITVSERPVLPVANFNTNTISGYAPLSVQFTDLSQNAASWYWDFGDGAVSSEPNPVHTYSSAGSYTVTQTVSNTNGTNSKYVTASVLDRPIIPVADFSTSATGGYAPLSIQFTDISQYAASRSWDFNSDGITDSSILSPIYTYTVPGTYTASLMVSNANGTNSKTAAITVLKPIPPVANFSSNISSGTVPLNILFSDTSKNTPTLWNWNFGDGTTNSTQMNPTHTYSKAGSYTVTLTVGNAAGRNMLRKTSYITAATLKPPVATLSANVTSGTVPLTVSFTDKSTGGLPASWTWSFGDGASSIEKNPVHTYSKIGRYTVRFTARNAAGSNTVTRSNYITVTVLVPPAAAFLAIPTSGSVPLNVTFTDKSTGSPVSWNWSFGDGTSSIEKNPVHIYSRTGRYTVGLTARNAAGSKTVTRSNYIVVNALRPPVAAFSASKTSGNAPFNVTFTDKSTGSPASWNWVFGDGDTSTQQNTDHTYSKAGKYTISLTASNAAGRNTLTRSGYINVGAPLKTIFGAFSASPASGKAPLRVQFTDRSTGSPTSLRWSFGDGTSSTVKNPVHTYTKKGKYTVSLTAGNSQGSNTKTMPEYITVS